jgi:hypothetical protein
VIESVIINKEIIILGNYNCSKFISSRKTSDIICTELEIFVNIMSLKQKNNIENLHGKILDLVLTNIDEIDVNPPPHGLSLLREGPYHPAIVFNYDCKIKRKPRCISSDSYNLKKGDYLMGTRGLKIGMPLSHLMMSMRA